MSKTYDTGVSRLVTHASTKPSSRMLNFEVLMDLGAFTLIWSYDGNWRSPSKICIESRDDAASCHAACHDASRDDASRRGTAALMLCATSPPPRARGRGGLARGGPRPPKATSHCLSQEGGDLT